MTFLPWILILTAFVHIAFTLPVRQILLGLAILYAGLFVNNTEITAQSRLDPGTDDLSGDCYYLGSGRTRIFRIAGSLAGRCKPASVFLGRP